jgi:hypothetical protein
MVFWADTTYMTVDTNLAPSTFRITYASLMYRDTQSSPRRYTLWTGNRQPNFRLIESRKMALSRPKEKHKLRKQPISGQREV